MTPNPRGAAVVLAALVVLTLVGRRIGKTFDADAPGGRGRLDEWRAATWVLEHHPRIAFGDGVDQADDDHGRDPLPDRAERARVPKRRPPLPAAAPIRPHRLTPTSC